MVLYLKSGLYKPSSTSSTSTPPTVLFSEYSHSFSRSGKPILPIILSHNHSHTNHSRNHSLIKSALIHHIHPSYIPQTSFKTRAQLYPSLCPSLCPLPSIVTPHSSCLVSTHPHRAFPPSRKNLLTSVSVESTVMNEQLPSSSASGPSPAAITIPSSPQGITPDYWTLAHGIALEISPLSSKLAPSDS